MTANGGKRRKSKRDTKRDTKKDIKRDTERMTMVPTRIRESRGNEKSWQSEDLKLCASTFFTKRDAILPEHFLESRGIASTSSSSRYYSARIHTLMECKSKLGMSEEVAEIEASKAHWTETKYLTATSENDDSSMAESSVTNCGVEQLSEEERVKLYEENVEVMRNLINCAGSRRFFEIGGTVGKKIGEGGQAEIYEVEIEHYKTIEQYPRVIVPEECTVMKVFKEGTSLLELQKQWPVTSRHGSFFTINEEWYYKTIKILRGRLLEDGRFAFQMRKCLGDLRKFLDVRMEQNGNLYPPLMKENGEYHERCMLKMVYDIAGGMYSLHHEGILHRDLKASNVLVSFMDWKNGPSKWVDIRLNLREVEDRLMYMLADYECSLGVKGTGFWRAPEILEASKNRTLHITPDLFTKESDIYSYAMTCYEIFTGFIPFEDPVDGRTSIEDVVEGKRPTLPSHLSPWVKELLHRCWHTDPLVRPSFLDILRILIRHERYGSFEAYFPFER